MKNHKENEPESEYNIDKVTQGSTNIELLEQLHIMKTARKYLEDYVFPGKPRESHWNLGFELHNEIQVSQGEQTVYRCEAEAFFQMPATGERKLTYRVTLIRFADDNWRVFHTKEISL